MWPDGRRFYDVTPSGDQDYTTNRCAHQLGIVRYRRVVRERRACLCEGLSKNIERSAGVYS